MSPRYILLTGAAASGSRERLLAEQTGLTATFVSERLTAFTNASCNCIPIGETGCILGNLFARHGPPGPVQSLSRADEIDAVQSRGKSLLTKFWGGYVTVIAGEMGDIVLRDPSGALPCYFAGERGSTAFASDADLLVQLGVAIEVDLEEIGRQLYRAFVPAPTTALRNIRELLAGFSLDSADGAAEPLPCWSPWDFVEPATDSAGASQQLAKTVRYCVEAWASTADRLLLSVSGGLDSSIIAACLRDAPGETVCITMFTDDPSGDERPFARALCEHLELELIERPYRLADVNLLQPLAPNLPRPRDRAQAIAHERVHYAVAAEAGADTFMTGNGGDHIFGYSQSAAPIADRYLREGLGRGTFASLLDVCRQTGCSLSDAFAQAWRLTRSSPAYAVRPNPLFLDPGFAQGLGSADLQHPWLVAPGDALPGKAAHIATILRVQPNLEPLGGTAIALLHPLVSQPIIEACLSIPSWDWRAGGRDRALARRAFADTLPPQVLERRVKGTPGRFAARLLDHFRGPIRDRLLGGHLSSAKIIDAEAIAGTLSGERPVPDLERVRLLELVNAEAWIDHWMARRDSAAGTPTSCDPSR